MSERGIYGNGYGNGHNVHSLVGQHVQAFSDPRGGSSFIGGAVSTLFGAALFGVGFAFGFQLVSKRFR